MTEFNTLSGDNLKAMLRWYYSALYVQYTNTHEKFNAEIYQCDLEIV